jgi:lipid A 3-O-deacylase
VYLLRRFTACAALGALLLCGTLQPALAISWSPYEEPNRLSLSGGFYDANDNEEAGVFNLEYRFRKGLWFIRPMVGVMATTEEAFYGYGGIYIDVPVTNRLILTPSFAAGGYEDGDGKDLGHTIEFRSKIELAYRFRNRVRISLGVSHISNASLGDNNPGTEIVSLSYAIPFYPMHPPRRR